MDRKLILWDVDSAQPIAILEGHDNYVVALALSLDGKKLASGSWDGTVRIWDPRADSWHLRACEIANRNLSIDEWETYIGDQVPYQLGCQPSAMPGK